MRDDNKWLIILCIVVLCAATAAAITLIGLELVNTCCNVTPDSVP